MPTPTPSKLQPPFPQPSAHEKSLLTQMRNWAAEARTRPYCKTAQLLQWLHEIYQTQWDMVLGTCDYLYRVPRHTEMVARSARARRVSRVGTPADTLPWTPSKSRRHFFANRRHTKNRC